MIMFGVFNIIFYASIIEKKAKSHMLNLTDFYNNTLISNVKRSDSKLLKPSGFRIYVS